METGDLIHPETMDVCRRQETLEDISKKTKHALSVVAQYELCH